MPVDLDDPWAVDESVESDPPNGSASSSAISPRLDTMSRPSEDSQSWSWSPTSPFSTDGVSRTAKGKQREAGNGSGRDAGAGLGIASPTKDSRPPRSASHPLALDAPGRKSIASDTDISDVSRPALRHMTSQTDRAVAESLNHSLAGSRAGSEAASSERGSIDLARAEVEVIVHQVKPDESLPGISLRYGIDLAVLRKVNKLWQSDPIHLRTHLYIPLEACKPTPNGDQIVRGPGDGQVTVVSRRRKVNGAGPSHRRSPSDASGRSANGTIRGNGNAEPERAGSPDTITTAAMDASSDTREDDTRPIVLDIVRLPASKLRFFPRGKRVEAARSRASLDSDLERSADGVRALSATERQRRREARATEREIAREMGTTSVFAPLGALTAAAEKVAREAAASKKRVVKLRPPQAPRAPDNSFTGQIKSLFTVPPPPVPPHTRPSRVPSIGSHSVHSDASLPTSQPPVNQVLTHSLSSLSVEMEMEAGPWGTGTPPRVRKSDKKRD